MVFCPDMVINRVAKDVIQITRLNNNVMHKSHSVFTPRCELPAELTSCWIYRSTAWGTPTHGLVQWSIWKWIDSHWRRGRYATASWTRDWLPCRTLATAHKLVRKAGQDIKNSITVAKQHATEFSLNGNVSFFNIIHIVKHHNYIYLMKCVVISFVNQQKKW